MGEKMNDYLEAEEMAEMYLRLMAEAETEEKRKEAYTLYVAWSVHAENIYAE